MNKSIDIQLGDDVQMRKPHACGENRWTIIRTGADIRVQCLHCGRSVLLTRGRFLRAVVKIFKAKV